MVWSRPRFLMRYSVVDICTTVSAAHCYTPVHHTCTHLVMTYCWASFIFAINSARSEFNNFWAISIWNERERSKFFCCTTRDNVSFQSLSTCFSANSGNYTSHDSAEIVLPNCCSAPGLKAAARARGEESSAGWCHTHTAIFLCLNVFSCTVQTLCFPLRRHTRLFYMQCFDLTTWVCIKKTCK